ncbi:MAG TPA: FG-GAP repeat protein, partial [Opitutaceae bacterium]
AGTASSGRCGAVFVFEWDGNTGITQVARLTPSDGAVGDRFGDSLAADGDRLIIGAPRKDVTVSATTYTDGGKVYLYDRASSGAWNLNRGEVATVPETNLQFGGSVAVRGQYFVIGAPNQDNLVFVTAGGSTLITNLPDAGVIYFGRWSETVGEINAMENPIVQEIANVDLMSVNGLAGSHFGTAITLDSSLTLLITAPDHTWSASNSAMSPYYGGSVFKLAWNGGLGDGWVGKWWRLGFPPTRFDEKIGKTAKWDEADSMSYLTSGSGSQVLSYFVRSAIGNEIGTKCAELIGHDFDQDPLSYSLVAGTAPTLSFWGPVPLSAGADKFQLIPGSGGEYYIASKVGAGLSAGAIYSVGVRVTDDRGGIKDVSTLIQIGGQLTFTDNDNDGIDDNWEVAYGLNPNDPSDGERSLNGDGLSAKEKYLRYMAGMAYGIDPTKWDLNPEGDEDGDGITNKMDADPFDPALKGLNMQILQPGAGGTF